MTPGFILLIIGIYFGVLLLISRITGKDDSNTAFFKAGNTSPWYVVAFGMIGASLSGVTFISVPGWVQASQFSYMQVVLGYALGYVVITFLLLPLYYRLNVTSIYEYLEQRFGKVGYKTGALFFILSRLLGASFKLFLVASVLQYFVFEAWGVPFVVTVVCSVFFIWLYTARAGMNTIVWTDALQTFCMLAALVLAVLLILKELDWGIGEVLRAEEMKIYTQVFFTENVLYKNYFWKAFLGGVFITVAMTGLDQDMMQKNLTCRNLKEAQKNMLAYGMTFIPINIIFLTLGALLFVYAHQAGLAIPERTDFLFPEIALRGELGTGLGIIFLLGLIAATFSSADSGMTALTTSFCIDILNIKKNPERQQKRIRKQVHLGVSAVLVLIIVIFNYVLSSTIIDLLLTAATYTYGPLLGLFAFGLFTQRVVIDKYVVYIALAAAGLSFLLDQLPAEYLGGYEFNYELLLVNGSLMFLGLWVSSRKERSLEMRKQQL